MSVTIGNGVTSIGDWAFDMCYGLTNITTKGDCPAVGGGAFYGVAYSCSVRLPKGNKTYDVVYGKWHGMTVEYYDLPSVPTVAIDDTKMEEPAEQGGKRVIAAKEGQTLTEEDVASVIVLSPIDTTKEITAAYTKTLVGNQITIELATPQVGVLPEQAEEAPEDEDDATGLLVVVDESEISAKPEPKNEETVGALPVKTYPGLWYQAEWGDDIGNLTSGEKVQATGGSLYLGVIKQTGGRGFYKISVSEK